VFCAERAHLSGAKVGIWLSLANEIEQIFRFAMQQGFFA
jgi:hypothetical protein